MLRDHMEKCSLYMGTLEWADAERCVSAQVSRMEQVRSGGDEGSRYSFHESDILKPSGIRGVERLPLSTKVSPSCARRSAPVYLEANWENEQ